ncbi:lasso RiPP family leader peptide-containing protein [Kitasatospora acidiphila]|uniref:Lasso RiPP family leader peptide-containing protein n=1 Tax=Kitasatospora acidiphila TaxID=2567942 RepID=A0A540W7D1_9ACTN|nr:lasso RiPP family leader peptide-containing protein [Kitasatospora acidiphila]TQF04919.1 lasso RiPP family leader peptide-containing protein [Kitasatospora acidiphila]
MSFTVYERPALQEIGDFEELTTCVPVGSCNDICGWQAPICLF